VRPYLEKTHHKKGLVEWPQGVGPEFKPQYCKKKKKKKKRIEGHFTKQSVLLEIVKAIKTQKNMSNCHSS
jgi:glutamine amidotransferase-like uncharacterized protein